MRPREGLTYSVARTSERGVFSNISLQLTKAQVLWVGFVLSQKSFLNSKLSALKPFATETCRSAATKWQLRINNGKKSKASHKHPAI